MPLKYIQVGGPLSIHSALRLKDSENPGLRTQEMSEQGGLPSGGFLQTEKLLVQKPGGAADSLTLLFAPP